MCPAQAKKYTGTGGGVPGVLDDLLALLSVDMAGVNTAILQKMESDVSLIPQLAAYIVAAGGKRIRPLLTLATAHLFGYHGQRHINLAACVEFIHTATLLHDDVVDESGQRRGQPSANAVFGNQASVLVGDFLFSRAFELMVEDGDLDVLAILSKASSTVAEGEVLQLATNDIDLGLEGYLRIVKAKTAALFAAACEVGGVVGQCSDNQRAALRLYGTNLGIAFQMADDLLDYSASQERLGKSIGDDFREGKITLPVVLAMQTASPSERDFWQRCLTKKKQDAGDLKQAQETLKSHDVFRKGLEISRKYSAEAISNLKGLPDVPVLGKLELLVDFVAERDY